MGKSAKNTASTTKDNIKTQYREKNNRERRTIGRYSRKTQHRKIAENENRAHNNHIDTGSTETQFLFSPFFCPQSHEKIHG